MYKVLRDEEYYIEELRESLDCVEIKDYSVLFLADLEKNFTNSELLKLRYDFESNYVSIIIISDWSSNFIQKSILKLFNKSKNPVKMLNFG